MLVRSFRAVVSCACLFITLIGVSSAQKEKVLAPHRPIAPRLPDNPPKTGPLRSMVGGLWMIDANFKSTIYIKNSVEIAPVTVTPILWLSNGKKVTLADVTLEPSGVATVSVNDGLNANGISPWATLNGYVEIQYKWPWDPLCVTATSVDAVHSVTFTNGLRPLEPMNPSAKAMLAKGALPQTIEGMWWKQEPQVSGFVALSNTTAQTMKAQLDVSDANGRTLGGYAITISPHGTKTVNLEELQSGGATAGGVRITYTGGMNDLLPNGGLEDESTGYSASIPFAPAPSDSKMQTMSYAELGLMTGAADPMMKFPAGTTFTPYSLLRNIGQQTAIVTPSIYWMQAGSAKSAQLPPIKLQPYQTNNLDVPSLLSLAGLLNFNGSFNLVFDVQGSVLMLSGSVDKKNTYVFEVMPSAVKESASKGLGYWSTKNGDDTMTTLWNAADEAQDLAITFFFSGGHYELPVHLAPRATYAFNMSEIIANGMPDRDGNIIPANAIEGSSKIANLQAENAHLLVAMDGGVYNVRKATCFWYCIQCDGMSSSSLAVLGFGIGAGGNVQMSLKATWNTGHVYDLTNVSTWTSNYTNIATVTTTGSSRGLVNGISQGQVTVNGADETEPWSGQSCGAPPAPCPPDQGVSSSGNGAVFDVGVKAENGNYILVGSDSHIYATNLFQVTNQAQTGAPQPSGGTSSATSGDSSDTVTQTEGPPNQLYEFRFQTADQSTTVGDRTLTFNYNLSSGAATSVQVKVTARKFAYLTNNTPSNACTLGHGTSRMYVYTVNTHPDNQPLTPGIAQGTPATESFNPVLTCGPITGNTTLSVNSQITDNVTYCSTAPLTCSETSTQTISVGGYAIRTNTLQWGSSGVTYTNDGPTQ